MLQNDFYRSGVQLGLSFGKGEGKNLDFGLDCGLLPGQRLSLPRQRNPAATQGDIRDSYLGLGILHCSFRV